MKVFVVGSGGQGGPCASILSKADDVSEILLGDINLNTAEQVKDKIGSDKIKAIRVDASSVDSLTEFASGMDVFIDLVIPEFSPNVLQAALNVGAHYISTAFDRPFWDELVSGKPLSFDNEFKEAGLSAVLGCGMAPGFINIVTKYYADKLDTVESIRLRIAKKKLGIEEMLSPFSPGWSPRQALIDCNEPAYYFEDGEMKITPSYSGLEDVDFPEPLGKMKVTHHAHEEPLTIPTVIKKGLKYCDFKYYLSPQPAVFTTAGLVNTDPVEVNGVDVKPLDLLLKLLPKTENAFFNEDPSKYDELDESQFVCLMSEIKGTAGGQDKTWKIHMPKLTAKGHILYDLFGTSLVNVALPAIIAARMIIDGKVAPGISFPEALDAKDFLDRFLGTGIPYEWHEL